MTWAVRLKRVFDIEIDICSDCGGDVRIIASIEDPVAIRMILAHLNKKMALAEISLLTAPVADLPPVGHLRASGRFIADWTALTVM